MANRPILHCGNSNASSWAMRAWLALKEAEIAFDTRWVDIRRPQRFANLEALRPFSPSASVPLLEVGETVIFDSFAIMEWANERCDGRLLPKDGLARATARSVVAWQHAGLSGLCGAISFESGFYPNRRALDDQEHAEALRFFTWCDRWLDRSGGPFLFRALSLADLALVPAVFRLHAHGALADAPIRAATWAERLLARKNVTDWLDMGHRETPIWHADYLPLGEDSAKHVRDLRGFCAHH